MQNNLRSDIDFDIVSHFMQLAMEEARLAGWATHPNPMVGAVIVRGNEVLAKGFHRGSGNPHAEVEALRNAKEQGLSTDGADMYVTLEPCNHYGKTPPCTEAIIQAGIKRVFVGTLDWDKRVHGAGIQRLREAGITCHVGFCEDSLIRLNAAFFKRVRTGLPYISLKWAMTLDGHITAKDGSSKWITSPAARLHVHEQRALHDAIMVGTGTVLADDPELTVRLKNFNKTQPLRVVLDRNARIPKNAKIFDTTKANTVYFTTESTFNKIKNSCENIDINLEFLDKQRIPVEIVRENDKGLNIEEILRILVDKYCVTTLYCEGGAGLAGTLCDLNLVDAFWTYLAPKVVGSPLSLSPVAGEGVANMGCAENLRLEHIEQIENDLCLLAVRDFWKGNL